MALPSLESQVPQPDYSFEVFFARYGNQSGIEQATLQQMWDDAEQLMPPVDSPVYGYHNASHAQTALWNAMAISERREAENSELKVNRRVLTLAVLFHDVMYDTPPQEHNMGSKEAFSAYMMRHTAPDYDFTDDEIDFADQIIMATKLGTAPQTLEEEIMIEADISNIAQDYVTRFKQSLLDLAGEAIYEKRKSNEPFNTRDFCAGSIKVLCTYLSFLDKNSPFVEHATKNIRRLAAELAAQEHTSRAKYIYSLGSSTVNKVLGYRLPLTKD